MIVHFIYIGAITLESTSNANLVLVGGIVMGTIVMMLFQNLSLSLAIVLVVIRRCLIYSHM